MIARPPPLAAAEPRIRYKLKTKVKCVSNTVKDFGPKEFSGVLGTNDRVIHKSHSLAGKKGLVWCWKCGSFGTAIPRNLIKPCNGAPTSKAGADNLKRLRRGLPPWQLKGKWPYPDSALEGQLTIG